MKITKYEHACLLVEMPEPVNRTLLLDPGAMSETALSVDKLEFLDDIVVTHNHPDHYHLPLLQSLVERFPKVRITSPAEVVTDLVNNGISQASVEPPAGLELFNAPHESVEPLFPRPQQIGVHYLDTLTHPGDSHSFAGSKAILALPVSGPWASTITAVNLAIKLKPAVVLPIHDWHWSTVARQQMYGIIAEALKKEGIEFIHLETGKPEVIKP